MRNDYMNILKTEELKMVYEASLKILSQTGMIVDCKEALDILDGAGAKVDRDSKRVKFPSDLIESRLKMVPKSVTYRGRKHEFDTTISLESEIYARIPGGATNYVDVRTGQYRRARIADWKEFLKLVDAMPSVCSVSTFHCGDVPLKTADIHSLYALLTEQRKCILHNAFTVENQKYIIEMALAVAGGSDKIRERSQVRLVLSPISPLYLNRDDTEQLLQACKYGIPVDIPIMPVTGTTSPITLAGTLALANAEYLGTMTLAQLANPGHDMPFFVDPVVANMRTGAALFAAPETAILIAAICQLGREIYGLPGEAIGNNPDGFTTEQYVFQKLQNTIMQVMSGGKLVIGNGAIESTMALSPVQLIIDEEIMNIARRLARGMAVNEKTLAVDVINRVGPRGHFITDPHTLEFLKAGELMDTELFERTRRDMWLSAGGKTIEQKAREKAIYLLEHHTVEPVEPQIKKELDAILSSADRNLAK
jgi:trimethylamine--corrinoid protein Co-methyltransferase